MLSKEQVLEIISYCESHGVTRKTRLQELGIREWDFYESRRRYLDQEKKEPTSTGHFIQLENGGDFVPSTVMELEGRYNGGRGKRVQADDVVVECRTRRGGMIRISGKISVDLMGLLVREL